MPLAFDDAAMIAACRKGRMDAFGSLIAKYQDRLYNAILRMCGDRDQAADLCQEAFVKVLERLDTFRGNSQFYTWLFRIAVNLTISRRRRDGRVRFTSLSSDVELGDGQAAALAGHGVPARQTDPARQVMDSELMRRVLEAMETLEDEFRVVVVLRDIEGMDYDQIASVLSAPVGTVKSRLHRARLMLREKLGDIVDAKVR